MDGSVGLLRDDDHRAFYSPALVFPDARVIARNYGLRLRKARKDYGTAAVTHF